MGQFDNHALREWQPICPSCQSADLGFDQHIGRCSACLAVIEKENGAWRFLAPGRRDSYRAFLDTYTRVRIAEGRGTLDSRQLRALPSCHKAHPLAAQWRIRARSYAQLVRLLGQHLSPGNRVLDLGAGTGWLSNRLFEQGYSPCAIDLSLDIHDGLGAAQAFGNAWPRLQAEFDALPFADNYVDCVIFNASFHYCADPERTIAEAWRVLTRGGILVILDTPFYCNGASGRQMLEEQQQYFEELIGERSDALDMVGFLTWRALDDIGNLFDINWNIHRPWYGLRWAWRPVSARLRGRREPAAFVIAWARKSRRHG